MARGDYEIGGLGISRVSVDGTVAEPGGVFVTVDNTGDALHQGEWAEPTTIGRVVRTSPTGATILNPWSGSAENKPPEPLRPFAASRKEEPFVSALDDIESFVRAIVGFKCPRLGFYMRDVLIIGALCLLVKMAAWAASHGPRVNRAAIVERYSASEALVESQWSHQAWGAGNEAQALKREIEAARGLLADIKP